MLNLTSREVILIFDPIRALLAPTPPEVGFRCSGVTTKAEPIGGANVPGTSTHFFSGRITWFASLKAGLLFELFRFFTPDDRFRCFECLRVGAMLQKYCVFVARALSEKFL